MASLAWDRLLETCSSRNASDVLLMPGFAPSIRLQDEVRTLQVPPVEPADLEHLLREIFPAPPAVPASTDEYAYQDFSYGETVWFRALAFGYPQTKLLLVMRHSLDWRPPRE